MTSQVDIANRALITIGADRITSFSDDTLEAKIVNQAYDGVKKFILKSYPWNCAIKRATCALLTDTPVSEFDYKFRLPNDCLRVLKAYPVGKGSAYNWSVEGRDILSDQATLSVKYVSSDISEDLIDAHVVSVIVYRLAMEIAYSISASNTSLANIEAMYNSTLDEARTTDALESTSRQLTSESRFTALRV
jgi:hypothetical protein